MADLCERIQEIRERYPTRRDLFRLVEQVQAAGHVEALVGERPFPPEEAGMLAAMLGALGHQAESLHAALDRLEQAFCRRE